MRKQKVSNEDKSIYIAGTMALALFTFLTLCGVFIAQALGVGVIAGVVTHIFFSEFYYKIKDWLLLPIANSQSVHKIIRTLKIQNYSEVVNYD